MEECESHSSGGGLKLPVPKKNNDFQMWKMKFNAHAAVKGWGTALSQSTMANLPAAFEEPTLIDVTAGDDAAQMLAKLSKASSRANTMAMAAHALAFEDTTHQGMVTKSHSVACPGGLAHKVTKALEKKHQPNDEMGIIELSQELDYMTVRTKEDPQESFNQLSVAKNERARGADGLMTVDTYVSKIIGLLLEKCEGVVARVMQAEGDVMTAEHLEDAVLAQHRVSNEKDKGNELSIFECCDCGKTGHKAHACPDRSSGGQGRSGQGRDGRGGRSSRGARGGGRGSQRKCHDCEKHGHIKANCWALEESADQRPSNCKKDGVGKQGNASVDDDELLMVSVETEEADSGHQFEDNVVDELNKLELKEVFDFIPVDNDDDSDEESISSMPGLERRYHGLSESDSDDESSCNSMPDLEERLDDRSLSSDESSDGYDTDNAASTVEESD